MTSYLIISCYLIGYHALISFLSHKTCTITHSVYTQVFATPLLFVLIPPCFVRHVHYLFRLLILPCS